MVVTNIINGLTALGTIAVAVSAIWGDRLRSRFDPLELTMIKPTPMADPTTFSIFSPLTGSPPGTPGTRVMFYHLTVINRRRWRAAENCRVMLVGITRRDPANIFQPMAMPVPMQLVWAPAEITPPSITITREQVLDLGFIVENDKNFIPRLYSTPNNFQGYVGPNEAVRYHLQIEAVNFTSPIYVVEVAWDGQWSYDPTAMERHLPIRLNPT